MFYAIALLEVGRRAEAVAEGDAALAMSPGGFSDALQRRLPVCAARGTKKAVGTLREAIDAGVTNTAGSSTTRFRSHPPRAEYLEMMQGQ